MATAAERYARLRVTGEIYLNPEDTGILPTLRRLGKADGLKVVSAKARLPKGQPRWMGRSRITTVNLCATDGMTIVRPDANQESR